MVVDSHELGGCFYDAYYEAKNDKKYLIITGDNEVKIFEVTE